MRLSCTLLLFLSCFAASSLAAQDSRSEEIARQQAEKAKGLKPYEPSAAERILVDLQRKFIEQPGGFFPYLQSVYSGGGLTLGAGYRWLYGDRAMWDVKGLYLRSLPAQIQK